VRVLAALACVAVLAGCGVAHADTITDRPVLFAAEPTTAGLVTNEYAYWNPTLTTARRSPLWEMTSGSLFAEQTPDGLVYSSGTVDDRNPDALSAAGTDSAVFRLTTVRHDFGDISVRVKVKVGGMTTTRSTPAVDWDGLHLFLRYQTEHSLYYASINRRDGQIVVKKKCPGGPSNGGTYWQLGDTVPRAGRAAVGQWKWYSATIHTQPDGSVTIGVYRVDQLVTTAIDHGTGCPPITAPGKVGIRGDNTRFQFVSFRVRAG